MYVRSDVLTAADIRSALADTRHEDGVDIRLDDEGIREFRPRKFAHGFQFYCESLSGSRSRNGRSGYAASWTAYGLFMARLYKLDPLAEISWYKDAADFIRWTEKLSHHPGNAHRGMEAPWLADALLHRAAQVAAKVKS